MLSWLIIIVSLIFAYVGYIKGFYVMFATLFNLMFAVFISVFSASLLLACSPGLERSGYYAALSIFLGFVLIFILLQAFAWFFFFQYRDDYFPLLFDKIGSVVLGFLSGHVLCGLLILVVCITPFSKQGKIDWLCKREKMKSIAKSDVIKACDFLGWYSLHCFDKERSEKEVDWLLELDDTEKEEDSTLSTPIIELIEEDESI